MNGQNDDDPIQEAVEGLCASFEEVAKKRSLVIVHFLCGTSDTAGAIRKSSISLGSKAKSPVDRSVRKRFSTGSFLHEHIREMHRPDTLLSMLESWAIRQTSTLELEISIGRGNHSDNDLKFEKGPNNESKLLLSENLINELSPSGLGPTYLCALDSQNLPEIDKLTDNLHLRRAAAFGKAKLNKMNERQACAFLSPKDVRNINDYERDNYLWRALGGLQSALTFFSLIEGQLLKDREARIFIHKVGVKRGAEAMFIAFFYPFKLGELKPSNVHNKMSSAWKDIQRYLVNSASPVHHQVFSPQFEPDASAGFDDEITDVFEISVQQRTALGLAYWLIWLTQKLNEKTHEGHELQFWFVVGDRTQFGDNGTIQFRTFEELKQVLGRDFDNALMPLGVPLKNSKKGRNRERVESAAKFLAGEHYPWFQEGKYALFWDVTALADHRSKALHPYGLVSIVGTSWEQYLKQAYSRIRDTILPANLLIYTKTNPSDSGLIVSPQEPDRPLRRLLHMRNGLWRVTESENRRSLLTKNILASPVIRDDELRQQITDMIIHVADNPTLGATLLILRRKKSCSFTQMGIPWKFINNSQDIEALMSHDGATILQEEPTGSEGKWNFRMLLSADGIDASIRKKFEELAKKDLSFPLAAGAGSRRWSAALACLGKDVLAIIAVSQDGDITSWRDTGKNVRIDFLPQGKPSKSKSYLK